MFVAIPTYEAIFERGKLYLIIGVPSAAPQRTRGAKRRKLVLLGSSWAVPRTFVARCLDRLRESTFRLPFRLRFAPGRVVEDDRGPDTAAVATPVSASFGARAVSPGGRWVGGRWVGSVFAR